MANHRQAEKRNRQRVKKQDHNRHSRTTMRTLVKRVKAAIAEKNPEKAQEALNTAVPQLDRCAGKVVMPKKRASRTISRLTKAVNALKS